MDTGLFTAAAAPSQAKPEHIAKHMLLYQVEGLLDPESRAQWELRRSSAVIPTLAQLLDFLELRASMLADMAG